ncbi:MAG: hypothetical protein ACR2PK_03540 [Acidimicrobiales bacterium]
MIGVILRTAIVLILVLVLQVELFAELRVLDVMPELLLGVSIAAGWAGGPERGVVVGFCAGLLYDLYLPTPLAMSAMTYLLVAFGVGLVSAAIGEAGGRPARRLVTLAAIPLGITLFVVLGELLGEDLYTDDFARLLIVATIYTGLLMPPLHWAMRWAFGVSEDRAPTPMRLEMVE